MNKYMDTECTTEIVWQPDSSSYTIIYIYVIGYGLAEDSLSFWCFCRFLKNSMPLAFFSMKKNMIV